MKFAVGVPNVREYGEPRRLVNLAQEAERAGWDGFFIWDHLVYRDRDDPVADPVVVVGGAASLTERIRLGVLVTAVPRRRPWKLAREMASLDVLSGGRLVFGAGLGSLGDLEYSAFGEDANDRVRAGRLDEALEVMAGLWSGEVFGFQGEYYSVAETRFLPTPVQRPRIPIWIAGRWPNRRPFRRAARWDGVYPTHRDFAGVANVPPDELRAITSYTRKHRSGSGDFDVVLEAVSGDHRSRDTDLIEAYGDCGLTWWVEKVGWFRGPFDEMRERVRRGPPA